VVMHDNLGEVSSFPKPQSLEFYIASIILRQPLSPILSLLFNSSNKEETMENITATAFAIGNIFDNHEKHDEIVEVLCNELGVDFSIKAIEDLVEDDYDE